MEKHEFVSSNDLASSEFAKADDGGLDDTVDADSDDNEGIAM